MDEVLVHVARLNSVLWILELRNELMINARLNRHVEHLWIRCIKRVVIACAYTTRVVALISVLAYSRATAIESPRAACTRVQNRVLSEVSPGHE